MNVVDIRQDFLDGLSARHKASTYAQDDINTERRQISMPRVRFEPKLSVF
jgi:hypothetical protein